MSRGVQKVTFSLSGDDEASRIFTSLASQTRNAAPAFNEMLDEAWRVQRRWWRTHGNSTWAKRKEPYHSWMRKHYPMRPILRGPDRKGHKGLQLRNQLAPARRPFGIEKYNNNGFTYGTNLPYAIYHQEGIPGRMVARPPLKPLNDRDIKKMTAILDKHITKGLRGRALNKPSKHRRGRR